MLKNLILTLSVLCGAGFWALWGLWAAPLGFLLGFVGCLGLCALLLWVPSLFVDPEEPQEESRYARTLAKLYAPMVFWLCRADIHATGTEKLPKEGRFLLVCNHISQLDPGIPLTLFPDAQLAFISKKENLDLPIIGKMMLKIQCQMLDRENDRAALKTILKCISILKEDKASIAVFPEGGTSKDGKLLHHLRPGVFKIAQKAKVPIVVCTLRGTEQIRHNLPLRKTDVHFHLLEVLGPEELAGVSTVEIAQRVHDLMAADLGAENVAS